MEFADIHSHILPMLDDGSKSVEQSVNMLQIAAGEGIKYMIATPHNMPGKGHSSYELICNKASMLQELCETKGIPIVICIGTEYFYREEVLDILEREEAITLNNSEYVLVEFDPAVDKIYFRNAVRDVMATGHRPVIAHVERYVSILRDILLLADIKKMGALLQVNAASVVGDNGRQARKDVRRLLKERLIDFVATDAHSDGSRAPYMQKCASILYKKYGREYAKALLGGNAEKYLNIKGREGR